MIEINAQERRTFDNFINSFICAINNLFWFCSSVIIFVMRAASAVITAVKQYITEIIFVMRAASAVITAVKQYNTLNP
jgi:hypothetical protein